VDQPNILIFFETVVFSIIVLAWAGWEYFSVSRLQKKQKEDAAKAAGEGEPGADHDRRSQPVAGKAFMKTAIAPPVQRRFHERARIERGVFQRR
jgi:hypothetical protein